MMTQPTSDHPTTIKSLVQNTKNLVILSQKIVDERNVFDVALIMTLFLLILHLGGGYLTLPIILLGMAAFFFPSWRTSGLFWGAICIILVGSNIRNWFRIDNHIFLINYWALAIFFSLLTPKPKESLASSARWIIGIVFFFATLWKVISVDYLNSSFFHYELLLDDRFSAVARFVGGLTQQVSSINYEALDQLLAYNSTLQSVQLQDTVWIAWIAYFLTWWTVIIEGLVAVAFLWPKDKLISKWRDATLLLFLTSTYSVAPVIGFGWVLTAMGVAQSSSSRYIRLLYVLAFLLLKFYHFVMIERPIF